MKKKDQRKSFAPRVKIFNPQEKTTDPKEKKIDTREKKIDHEKKIAYLWENKNITHECRTHGSKWPTGAQDPHDLDPLKKINLDIYSISYTFF